MQNAATKISGNSFIDSNHDSLLELMDALTPFVRDSWEPELFSSGVRNLIAGLENHFSHEETVLRGAQYGQLDEHSVKHRELSMELRMQSLGGLDQNNAVRFLGSARTKVLSHELFEDQEYWPLFDDKNVEGTALINWSVEYETGDFDTDTI